MKLKKLFLALVSLAILSSCNMMKEDEDLTNCGLFVTFKYDYNLQHSDMFGDHVGGCHAVCIRQRRSLPA